MAFFRNRTVNLLNLHYGIHSVALSGGAAFFVIYLLKAGMSVHEILLSLALILMGRFAIRPLVIVFGVRFGQRAMVIAGSLFNAMEFPILAEVHGVGVMLLVLIVVSAVAETVYWTSYHAYFAALSDDDHRGQQVGVREAAGALVGIASPLIAGWMLVTLGPRVAFGVTGAIMATAALPLLWARDVAVTPRAPGILKAAAPGVMLFVADGWIAAGYSMVWQIALFIALGESIMAYGGALAFAALVGAIGGMTLGRHIDAGHGGRAVWCAMGTLGLIVMLRALATRNPALAVLANALGAFGGCLYIPTLMTAVYTMAKHSPCTLRFHVAAEGGWDFGGAAGLLTAALMTSLGAPLSASVLLSLAGVAGGGWMLRRHYTASAARAIAGA